ncbi:Cof-type HAD-IIB family hydrolase [Clostridium sp. ZS2-4]|uniref:Cof-type HAD-IIB family hydrolase n=1 Tax=Clostridium sp. ZS2-4 TaxID=2987703 RepID=UPI00227AF5A3|nr:Cof-type HAD-IIB family hydrolase [Clostridium sp. ZS2-4]MCY6356799.1 Cof-type HAD-IIB family hydrolase [Clostridium sp. ZS2-4]
MYKLIAVDMDGTLLRNDKTISKETYTAIESAKAKGVKIVLCTGRPIQGVQGTLKYLNLISDSDYVVTCSGAVVQCTGTSEIISQTNLTPKDAAFLYNLSKKLNITLNAVTPDYLITPTLNFTTGVEAYLTNLPVKIVDFDTLNENIPIRRIAYINETQPFIDKIKSLVKHLDVKYTALDVFNRNDSLFCDPNNLPDELYEKYTVLKPSSNTLEILSKNANKGTGVAVLAEKLGIKRYEIICIGDSGNDIDMIKYAGLGVAMGNAFPEIKKIADYVTLTNEENGVAHVINKFILKKEEKAV